jgi:hypothetical protein
MKRRMMPTVKRKSIKSYDDWRVIVNGKESTLGDCKPDELRKQIEWHELCQGGKRDLALRKHFKHKGI